MPISTGHTIAIPLYLELSVAQSIGNLTPADANDLVTALNAVHRHDPADALWVTDRLLDEGIVCDAINCLVGYDPANTAAPFYATSTATLDAFVYCQGIAGPAVLAREIIRLGEEVVPEPLVAAAIHARRHAADVWLLLELRGVTLPAGAPIRTGRHTR